MPVPFAKQEYLDFVVMVQFDVITIILSDAIIYFINSTSQHYEIFTLFALCFWGVTAAIFLSLIIRGYKKGRSEKEILSNPVHIEGTITEIVPDTPSKLGVVNIEVDYEFKALDGTTYRNKHARTVIKTMDLYNYKIGTKVPIVYLKTDPSRNMLNIKNEIPP